jgi:hypothetical protein
MPLKVGEVSKGGAPSTRAEDVAPAHEEGGMR